MLSKCMNLRKKAIPAKVSIRTFETLHRAISSVYSRHRPSTFQIYDVIEIYECIKKYISAVTI